MIRATYLVFFVILKAMSCADDAVPKSLEARIATKIAEYDRLPRKSSALGEALGLADGMNQGNASDLPADKDWEGRKLAFLLQIWSRITHSVDLEYDWSNVPWLNIPGPKGFMPGSDPNTIEDPVARAKYVAEARANLERAEDYSRQMSLWGYRKKCAQVIIRLMGDSFKDEEGRKKAEQMINASELDADLKRQLLLGEFPRK